MRLAIAGLLLAGCVWQPPSGGDDTISHPLPDNSGWGSGWGGSGGPSSYGCQADSECSTITVCARNGECTSPSSVRVVHVTWTLKGMPASTATCASAPQLDITFSNVDEMFGFSPVPCSAGKFTVDKLPTRYTTVQLGRGGDGYGGPPATFDAMGNAAIDLPY